MIPLVSLHINDSFGLATYTIIPLVLLHLQWYLWSSYIYNESFGLATHTMNWTQKTSTQNKGSHVAMSHSHTFYTSSSSEQRICRQNQLYDGRTRVLDNFNDSTKREKVSFKKYKNNVSPLYIWTKTTQTADFRVYCLVYFVVFFIFSKHMT